MYVVFMYVDNKKRKYTVIIGKCVYKGNEHLQGSQWSDGCDYDCQCIDANRGHYTCTDK